MDLIGFANANLLHRANHVQIEGCWLKIEGSDLPPENQVTSSIIFAARVKRYSKQLSETTFKQVHHWT